MESLLRDTCAGDTPMQQTLRWSGGGELDGDAVEHRGAGEGVDGVVVGEQVGVDPGVAGGDVEVGARQVVAPAVGQADDARADRARSPRPGTTTAPTRLVTLAWPPSTRPGGDGVVGVDVEHATRLALDEHLDVVHPRVVRAQVAAADEHEAVGERCAAPRPSAAGRRGSAAGATSIIPVGVRRPSGRRG